MKPNQLPHSHYVKFGLSQELHISEAPNTVPGSFRRALAPSIRYHVVVSNGCEEFHPLEFITPSSGHAGFVLMASEDTEAGNSRSKPIFVTLNDCTRVHTTRAEHLGR
jgi:hypothetical protein